MVWQKLNAIAGKVLLSVLPSSAVLSQSFSYWPLPE